MSLAGITEPILRWAAAVDRPLPWRGERDPYRVLVSEVMLQQTQASRVVASYLRFLERFPTVEALAAAPAEAVLVAWGTLGYNRRALHLLRAARTVVGHGGFAHDVDELRTLPGVGPYTARAVASFAFGLDHAVVEANVRRFLTRLEGLPPDADVAELADTLLPRGRAARWNQALMDLGALVCRPRNPSCRACPVASRCRWAAGVRPPRRRSVRPEPPFASTTRYARGRVVGALRGATGGLDRGALCDSTGLDRVRVDAAVDGLLRDGVLNEADVVRLGEPVLSGRGRGAGERRR